MYRVGLIGVGRIAHFHVAGIREVLKDRAEVVAACDPRDDVLSAFCDQYKIANRFSSVEELARSQTVDVVIDITPPEARKDVVPTAIKFGLHVLVEKPFAPTAREALGYVELAEASGTKMSVNQNFRWYPEIEATKESVQDPDIGKLRFISHVNFQDRTLPPGDWRAHEKRLELAIFGVHILDRVLWIADQPPVSVSALMRGDSEHGFAGEEMTTMTLHFSDDLVANVTSSWLSSGLPEARLRVDAEAASIQATRWHAARGDATWEMAYRGKDTIGRYFRDTGDFARAFGKSLGKLLDGIDGDTEPVNSGRNNLRTIGALDAAYLSASRNGELVTLQEVGLDL